MDERSFSHLWNNGASFLCIVSSVQFDLVSSYIEISENRRSFFGSIMLPFLRRMLYLEELILFMRISSSDSFVDGSYSDNSIVS